MSGSRFYNTTELCGEILRQAKESANNQKEFVETLFASYDFLSPSQAYSLARRAGLGCTLNGIRAAFTNMTTEGILEKTKQKVTGPHGRPEYLWSLNPGTREKQQEMEF